MPFQTLSIIVPAYNEEATISAMLQKIVSVKIDENIAKDIIVIDDGSQDNTKDLIEAFMQEYPDQIRLIEQPKNMGKGAAIHRGIREAKGEYLIIQDADLEYDPEDYHIMLKPVIKGQADVVYGSRFMGSQPHRVLFFWHRVGNAFLTTVSNAFTNLNLTDMESCYKLFRTDLIRTLELKEKRFGFEPEVTAKIARIHGVRIYEVGVSYYGRTYKEGKKITWRDGLHALFCIFKYNI